MPVQPRPRGATVQMMGSVTRPGHRLSGEQRWEQPAKGLRVKHSGPPRRPRIEPQIGVNLCKWRGTQDRANRVWAALRVGGYGVVLAVVALCLAPVACSGGSRNGQVRAHFDWHFDPTQTQGTACSSTAQPAIPRARRWQFPDGAISVEQEPNSRHGTGTTRRRDSDGVARRRVGLGYSFLLPGPLQGPRWELPIRATQPAP